MHHSGMRRLVSSAGIVIAAFFLVTLLARPKSTGPCEVAIRATLPDVPEASGLALSRRHPGVIWTHNDSGNDAVLFAIDATSGMPRGHVRVPAQLRDWEALSAARCDTARPRSSPTDDCLFIGDIGDNSRGRPRVQVLVVPEPNPGDADTRRPDRYLVSYPDGPHNAEAMFMSGGRLFIITRDRKGTLYGSVSPLGEEHAITLRRINDLGLEAVTDAGTSPDGASVAVRTSRAVLLYHTADLIAGNAKPHLTFSIAVAQEPQGEGLAVGEGRLLYLASEGGWLSRAGRFTVLRCSVQL